MNNLKKIINRKGIKQDWVAKQLGVTRQTISNWVNNKRQPSPCQWNKIAEILNIRVDEIFFDSNSIITNNNTTTTTKTIR